MSNWRSQLDEIEEEYLDIFPELSNSIKNQNSLVNTLYIPNNNNISSDDSYNQPIRKGIRFPLTPKQDLLEYLTIEQFPTVNTIDNTKKNKRNSASTRRLSMNSNQLAISISDILKVVNPLIERIIDNRQLSRDYGYYLYNLVDIYLDNKNNAINGKEMDKRIVTDAYNHVKSLLDEVKSILQELDYIQTTRIEEIIPDINVRTEDIRNNKEKIVDLCLFAREQTTMTNNMLDNLLKLSNDLVDIHKGISCRADGVTVDWSIYEELADKFTMSKRCLSFVVFMRSRGFQVCGGIYFYLLSNKEANYTIRIEDYEFKEDELDNIIMFFRQQQSLTNNTHQLIINNCHLNDRQIHSLTNNFFPICNNLKILSLQSNEITDSGVISLAISLWDNYIPYLEVVRLDSNKITIEGMKLLTNALKKSIHLHTLTISHNNIGDWGLYYLTKLLINRRRSVYNQIPTPSDIFTISKEDFSIIVNIIDPNGLSKVLESTDLNMKIKQSDIPAQFYTSTDRLAICVPVTKKFDKRLNKQPSMNSSYSLTNEDNEGITRDNNESALLNDYEDYDDDNDNQTILTLASKLSKTNFMKSYNNETKSLDDFEEYLSITEISESLTNQQNLNNRINQNKLILILFQSHSKKSKKVIDDVVSVDSVIDEDIDEDINDDDFTLSDEDPYSSSDESEVDEQKYDYLDENDTNPPETLSISPAITSTSKSHSLTKLQLLLIKVQYKLFAIIAFNQIYKRRTFAIRLLDISNCNLTYKSLLYLRFISSNNGYLNDINISNNKQLFKLPDQKPLSTSIKSNNKTVYRSRGDELRETIESTSDIDNIIDREVDIRLGGCKSYGGIYYQLLVMLSNSQLRSINIRNCELNQDAMETITQAMNKSKYLERLDISNNNLGPTSLNWLTNTFGNYYIDNIQITNGKFTQERAYSKVNANDFGEVNYVTNENIDNPVENFDVDFDNYLDDAQSDNYSRQSSNRNRFSKSNRRANSKDYSYSESNDDNSVDSEDKSSNSNYNNRNSDDI